MYRMRLGFLFLGRIIVIVHRGRTSGTRYESGLEVIDRGDGELFVFAAWGTKSDWFRNIEASGVEELWDGSSRTAASFRVVTDDEAYGILSAYEEHHRTSAKLFFPRMYEGYDFTEVSRRALAGSGVVVAFRPVVGNSEAPRN
jgi:deazaflavin-dependent oxidoreductase (nitroreductase family)